MRLEDIWNALELDINELQPGELVVHSPVDGAELLSLNTDTAESVSAKVSSATNAFLQ